MKAMKFWIGDDEELSKIVQEILFKLGYSWTEESEIQNTDKYALFADNDGSSVFEYAGAGLGIHTSDTRGRGQEVLDPAH